MPTLQFELQRTNWTTSPEKELHRKNIGVPDTFSGKNRTFKNERNTKSKTSTTRNLEETFLDENNDSCPIGIRFVPRCLHANYTCIYDLLAQEPTQTLRLNLAWVEGILAGIHLNMERLDYLQMTAAKNVKNTTWDLDRLRQNSNERHTKALCAIHRNRTLRCAAMQ